MRKIILAAGASVAASVLAPSMASAGENPFIAEIRAVGQNWCPRNWAPLNGQILPISGNDALFSLIGCQYGGDCRTSFALPDMRGRVLLGYGQSPGQPMYPIGARGGSQTHTLTTTQMPTHGHNIQASLGDPERNSPAGSGIPTIPNPNQEIYTTAAPGTATMHGGVIGNNGGSQPFSLMQPYTAINYCIALYGVYPSRN